MTENRELTEVEEHGPAYRVGKASLGAVRDFRIAEHLLARRWAACSRSISSPTRSSRSTAATTRSGAMGFVRLKLD